MSRKLNLGCGFDKKEGYINADKFKECNPDVAMDIETFPWPFEDNSLTEIYAKHVLEHVGKDFKEFSLVFKEMYRVLEKDGIAHIFVPHHLHPTFYTDPTHVRAFTVHTFKMMSKEQNRRWIEQKANYTMLALVMDVDFELVRGVLHLDEKWQRKLDAGKIDRESLHEAVENNVGVISQIEVVLRCNK